MAIGNITSPANWVIGTVAAPQWFNDAQDTVNSIWKPNARSLNGGAASLLSFKSITVDGTGLNAVNPTAGTITSSTLVSRQLWIPFAGMIPYTNSNNSVGGTTWSITNVGFSATVTGAGGTLYCPLSFRHATGSGTSDQITAVAVRAYLANTGSMNCAVVKTINLSNTSAPSISNVATAGTSASGQQTITMSGLTLSPSADQDFYLSITNGNNGDIVYGALVTYSSVVF